MQDQPDSIGSARPHKPGRGWRIIASPDLTPSQFRCAAVPDGPCGPDGLPRWEGGACERNKAMLRAHFRKKAAECLIQPHHPPVNVLGGYKFPNAPVVNLTPVEPAPMPTTNPLYPKPGTDPLEIPDFLRRPLPRPERQLQLRSARRLRRRRRASAPSRLTGGARGFLCAASVSRAHARGSERWATPRNRGRRNPVKSGRPERTSFLLNAPNRPMTVGRSGYCPAWNARAINSSRSAG